MVIQCDSGDVNANLIACARYCVMDEFEKMREELRVPVHVVFIVQLPRGAAFTGFQVIVCKIVSCITEFHISKFIEIIILSPKYKWSRINIFMTDVSNSCML